MEMAYRERWEAEIVEMRRVLGGFAMKEECKWGKPTYTVDGKNIVIVQGFKEYFGLGFFQGALLTDPKKVRGAARPGARWARDEVHRREGHHGEGGDHQSLRARGHRSREGWAANEAEEDLRFSGSRGSRQRFRRDPRFKRAFEALTPGRQRSYLLGDTVDCVQRTSGRRSGRAQRRVASLPATGAARRVTAAVRAVAVRAGRPAGPPPASCSGR
jgi:hypothetical protein